MSNPLHVDQTVYTSFLFVAILSTLLTAFYFVQWRQGRCNTHPLYVQAVTAVVYSMSAAGYGGFVFSSIKFDDGSFVAVPIARYLFWVMTCPVILAGFISLLHYRDPTKQDINRTVFIVVKDLVVMCFGVLAAIQAPGLMKISLLVVSFSVSFWLVTDMFLIVRERSADFDGRLWTWLSMVCALFLTSWLIFPLLYVLGPPGYDAITREGDAIGHAIGDLIAKDVFGFIVWYFRFNVVIPHKKELDRQEAKDAAEEVSEFGLLISNKQTLDAKDNGPMKVLEYHGTVLVIEPEPHIQRLLMYVLEEARLRPVCVFDFQQARAVLRRGRMDEYSAVFLNLDYAVSHFADARGAMSTFNNAPVSTPILGFKLGATANPLVERELADPQLCNAVHEYTMDARSTVALVKFWEQTAATWRNRARALDEEAALHSMPFNPVSIGNSYGLNRSPLRVRNSFSLAPSNQQSPSTPQLAIDTGISPAGTPQPTSARSSVSKPNFTTSPVGDVPDTVCLCNAAGCSRTATMQCGACKLDPAMYCSRECQLAAWSSHKGSCGGTTPSAALALV